MSSKFLSAAKRRELAGKRTASGRGGVLPGGSGLRSRSRTIRSPAAAMKRSISAFVGLSALGLVVWWMLSPQSERRSPSVLPHRDKGQQAGQGSEGFPPAPLLTQATARGPPDGTLAKLAQSLPPVPLQVLPASVPWEFLDSGGPSPQEGLLSMPPRDPIDALNPTERTLLFLRIQKSGSNSLSDRLLPPNTFAGRSICSDHAAESVCGYGNLVMLRAEKRAKRDFSTSPVSWLAEARKNPGRKKPGMGGEDGLNHCMCVTVMRMEGIRWMTGHANECGPFINTGQERLRECHRIREAVGSDEWVLVRTTCQPLMDDLFNDSQTRVALPKCSRFSYAYSTPVHVLHSRRATSVVNPPWNALEAMKKMKQDEEDRKASGKTPSSAKLVPPEGVHIAYELQDDELRWLRDAYNSMDFLSGHFKSNYHTMGHKPGGFTYFTSLREPIHRVVSQWNWAVGMDWGYRPELADYSGITFSSWFSDDSAPMGFMARNHMTRIICGDTFWDHPELDMEEHEMRMGSEVAPITRRHLDCAKQKLTTHFGLVLIVENNTHELFEWLQPALNHLLGYPYFHLAGVKDKIVQNTTPQNTTEAQVKFSTLTASELQAATRANEYDIELYEFAQEVSRVQLRRLKTWWEERQAHVLQETLATRPKGEYCCGWGQ